MKIRNTFLTVFVAIGLGLICSSMLDSFSIWIRACGVAVGAGLGAYGGILVSKQIWRK